MQALPPAAAPSNAVPQPARRATPFRARRSCAQWLTRWCGWRGLCAMALLAILSACGGGGEDPVAGTTSATPSEVPNEIARGDITAATGGSLVVPTSAPSLPGTRVDFPPWAALEDLSVQIGFERDPPAPLRAEAQAARAIPVSGTIVLKAAGGGESSFNKLVTVTMPYDVAAAGGLPPAVLYWDDSRGRYRPAAVVKVDRANGTVSFATSHFSRYTAFVVGAIGATVPDVDTGFRVKTDSILHANFGTYAWDGLCAAFASFPTWYYTLGKAVGLYQFAQQGEPEQPNDDELTRSAMQLVYASIASNFTDAVLESRLALGLTDDLGMLMWQSMLLTGEPVHLLMYGWDGLEVVGHSVVAFAYDSVNARFRIYDSNFPKEETYYGWNTLTGFGRYSKDLSYLYRGGIVFDRVGYASDNTFGQASRFQAILEDWESGRLQSQLANLEITDGAGATRPLAFGADVVTTVPADGRQTVGGRFKRPRGHSEPVFLHVFFDGKPWSESGAVALDESGAFILDLPQPLDRDLQVILIASGSPRAPMSRLAAFGVFTVKVQDKAFLQNLGFETGDIQGWSAETRLLGSGAAFTPTKVEVVGIGTDPVATDLPTTASGKWALRVNDHGSGRHATTVWQRVTVPASGSPQIRLRWAAVLEDPRHSPDDQPYVEVVVRNVTRDVELHRQRFYTSDPTFSGWQDYLGGRWKAIPWQTVVVSGLGSYAGDELELRVEAADCALGAHGGTLYLDAAD